MIGRSRAAQAANVVGVLGLVAGAATTIARSLPRLPGLAPDTWVMVTAFTDFGVLPYAVALVALAAAVLMGVRPARLMLLVLSVALTAVHASWIVPDFVADGDGTAGPGTVVVLGQNMLFGRADPQSLLANARGADVLVLTELTAPAAVALEAAGVSERFPYPPGGNCRTRARKAPGSTAGSRCWPPAPWTPRSAATTGWRSWTCRSWVRSPWWRLTRPAPSGARLAGRPTRL